jgi:Na+-driven multidrug efflux pump
MSTVALDRTTDHPAQDMVAQPVTSVPRSPLTQRLLHGPIVPTLLQMAWPNVFVMVAQAATGLIETWFVSKLGTDALAGMALVFPGVMLMQMISAGAMGGGISSAIARALGAGRRGEADALVLHALVINVVLGITFSAIMLTFGRPIYRTLGGAGGELEAALAYSNVVFAGNVLLWVMNGLASAIRGTGNMLVPALVICVGVVFLVPLSPVLIFGIGPFPALGIAGAGVAVVSFYAAGTAVLAWYVLSGRNVAHLRWSRLRWPLFRDILGVGAVAALTSLQTNVIIAVATALVATAAGTAAAAGYGTSARLEYLLVPLVFGLGAPLVALVGHQHRRRPARAGAAHRVHRRSNCFRDYRGDRRGRCPVAPAVDQSIQHRSAGNRDRQRLFAPGRAILWLLRTRARSLLCIAGRRAAVLAAIRRILAHGRRHRRGLARALSHRLAAMAVCGARDRPVPARRCAVRGHRRRRLVSAR